MIFPSCAGSTRPVPVKKITGFFFWAQGQAWPGRVPAHPGCPWAQGQGPVGPAESWLWDHLGSRVHGGRRPTFWTDVGGGAPPLQRGGSGGRQPAQKQSSFFFCLFKVWSVCVAARVPRATYFLSSNAMGGDHGCDLRVRPERPKTKTWSKMGHE